MAAPTDRPKYSIEYAITITLHPSIRDLDTVAQYDTMRYIVRDHIKDMYKKHFPKSVYLPKVSLVCELTKSNDIHYHGTLQMPMNKEIRDYPIWIRNVFRSNPTKRNPIKKDLTKYLGYIVLKPITDAKIWTGYLCKTLQEFKERTNRMPIILDDCRLFTAEQLLCYGSC